MPINVLNHLGQPVAKPAPPKSELDAHIAPAKVSGTQVHGQVSTQKHSHGMPSEPENIKEIPITKAVQLGPDENIEVGFGVGRTVNLGNFESVKVNVSLRAPCSREGLESAYDWMTDWVGEKLNEAVKAAQG